MGVSTRPFADLTAPLAPGGCRGTGSEASSPLGAREPKGLRRRLRPLRPGFRVCSTTALALRAPGKPGSLSTDRNRSGRSPKCSMQKGTRLGAFLHGDNEPSAWEICARKSLFSFFLRSAQVNMERFVMYWIEAFCENRPTTHEAVTSLERGRKK